LIIQVLHNWASLQRSQWANRDSLLRLQNQRLRNIVGLAYDKVPFYRQLYQKAGIRPVDVADVQAVSRLPLVTKDQLRAASLEERTAKGTDLSRCRAHSPSGSTGKPLTILEDPTSAAFREALNLRILWAYGVRPLDRIVRIRMRRMGGIEPLVRLSDRRGLWAYVRARRTRQLTYYTDLKEHIRLLSKWKASVLIAQTSYCRTLAKFSETTASTLNFRIIVTTGEILDDLTRRRISDRFGAEVYDHYGAEEVGGAIAWECPSHSGYHIDAETLLAEFLSKGEPVKAGTAGEVHLTSFCRVATPIIRYFVGDIATPVDGECSCGRGLPMIKEIQGRRMDCILGRDGRVVSPMTVINAIQYVPGVDQFKVVQRRDFSIEVRIVTRGTDTDSVLENARDRCQPLLRDLPIDVRSVDQIENSNGPKFRLVESHIAQ
jgi:phenylacetate-CoA ligase